MSNICCIIWRISGLSMASCMLRRTAGSLIAWAHADAMAPMNLGSCIICAIMSAILRGPIICAIIGPIGPLMPPPKARASCPHPIMSRMPSTIPASNSHADRIPQHLRSIRLTPLSCISGRARTRQCGRFDIKESVDIVDQPLFWNGPNILRPNETMLIDDKGFRHPIDPKVDADLTRPVHSVLKSLTELTDKPLCGSFVILDVDSDHSNSANLGSFPDPLESRRFLIAGRVAPANPEVAPQRPFRGESWYRERRHQIAGARWSAPAVQQAATESPGGLG